MNNLKQTLQALGWRKDGKLLTHIMGWFGDSHYHPMTRYNSAEQSVIDTQLDLMQEAGIDGVIVTWQGPNNPTLHQTTLKLSASTAKRGMLFALLADPWLMDNQPNGDDKVIAALTNSEGLGMLNASSYLQERYFLDFTSNLFNEEKVQAAVRAKFPNFTVLKRHVGYSWPEITNTIPALKSANANPAMKIPGLCLKFFDGGVPSSSAACMLPARGDGVGRDYNGSSWGSGTSRTLEDQAGNYFFDQMAVTPLQSKYLAIVTWNDYNERTAVEPFFAMLGGKRIGA